MNVLLINPNRVRPAIPPIGLDYLDDALKASGHRVQLYDFGLAAPQGLKKTIQSENPDLIGISVRNIDDVNILRKQQYIGPLSKLIQTIKRLTPAKIVLGGAGFSMMPLPIIAQCNADFGIVGDGELAFPQLLDCLNEPQRVANLVYRCCNDPHRYRQTPGVHCDLTRLPPSRRQLVDYRRYQASGGACNVQTQRGCSRGCIFCPEPNILGRQIRLRPVEAVLDELAALASYGVRHKLFIVDAEFNGSISHAYQVVEAMIAKNLAITWCCYMTPHGVKRELLQAMKRAGCELVVWSLDAASQTMLDNLGKDLAVGDMMRVAADCDSVGLPYCLSLLFGGPGESEQTIEASFRNVCKTRATIIAVGTGIRIYPGTKLHQQALAEGAISADTNLLQPVYYNEQRLKGALLPLIKQRFANLPNCNMYGITPQAKVKAEINKVFPLFSENNQ